MAEFHSIDEANRAVAQKIIDAQPRFVDVVSAKDVIAELSDRLILHARVALELPLPEQDAELPGRLEAVIRETKLGSAREIFEAVKTDVLAFSPPADDISLVVLKRR